MDENPAIPVSFLFGRLRALQKFEGLNFRPKTVFADSGTSTEFHHENFSSEIENRDSFRGLVAYIRRKAFFTVSDDHGGPTRRFRRRRAEEQDCAPLFYEWRFIAPKLVLVPQSGLIPSFFLYVHSFLSVARDFSRLRMIKSLVYISW